MPNTVTGLPISMSKVTGLVLLSPYSTFSPDSHTTERSPYRRASWVI
jgi:hypothetical protein